MSHYAENGQILNSYALPLSPDNLRVRFRFIDGVESLESKKRNVGKEHFVWSFSEFLSLVVHHYSVRLVCHSAG